MAPKQRDQDVLWQLSEKKKLAPFNHKDTRPNESSTVRDATGSNPATRYFSSS